MGMSKCGSAARLGVCVEVQVQCGILPEVDGRWWAHSECTNQTRGGSRASVHMQGLCDLAQCAWCRLGGGQTQSSTQTFQQCTKHPWGLVWRCMCVGGQHGGWFSGSWSKLGVWKKCCELNKILPMPMLILLFHNK